MGSAVTAISRDTNAPLTYRLSQSISLNANEVKLLAHWQSARRLVRRRQDIVIEGLPCRSLFVIIEGAAIRYRILRGGKRHVLNVLLPGDVAGAPSCFFERALYSIRTITDAWVSPVPLTRILALLHMNPQLAAKLFWLFSCEAAIYAEHLVTVSRRTAFERVAHLLLELLIRLQSVDHADKQSFRFPLTQELIADALGLSIPYVNEVLRKLRDDDLVKVSNRTIVIKDVQKLATLVDFERSYLKPLSIGDLLKDVA